MSDIDTEKQFRDRLVDMIARKGQARMASDPNVRNFRVGTTPDGRITGLELQDTKTGEWRQG